MADGALEFFLQLLVVVLAARLCGEAAERLNQPSLVGELVAGVLVLLMVTHLAPGVPVLSGIPHSPAVALMADLGVFFLILNAGVEMRPSELARQSKVSFAVAAGGVALPLATGIAFGWAVLPAGELRLAQALLIGVTLSITAVPVALRVFMDLGLAHHTIGRTVIAAALIDDVLGLLLLALLTAVLEAGALPDAGSLVLLPLRVALFFVISVAVGRKLYPWLSRRLGGARSVAVEFSALVIAGLAFAALAEALGMHFILGPFVAGLLFERASVGRQAYRRVRDAVALMTNGFLGPIFFASIGLGLDLGTFATAPGLLAMLLAVAFLGKFVGAGLPARWAGLGWRQAAAVGVGMSGRGAVALAVAGIAFETGAFAATGGRQSQLYSALAITIVVVTVAMPVLLRLVLGKGSGLRSG